MRVRQGVLALRALERLRRSPLLCVLLAAAGCEPTLLTGKSPNVLAAEDARARNDTNGALRAYERALVADDLMAGERTEVALAMADVDQRGGHAEAVDTYKRLLSRGDLDASTRAVALARLVVSADRLEKEGRSEEAARLYELVLREGGTNLTGRERVLGKLRRSTERVARGKLEALAPQPSSMDKLAALAAVRQELHRVGASKGLVAETTRAMAVTADAAFGEAERLEREGRHAASLRFADALVAPLPGETRLRAKRDDLASRVGLKFETMIVGAQGYPGAVALRTGWMLRATGRAHPARKPAFEDLDRRARAQYALQLGPTVCSEIGRSLAGGFGGAKGVLVQTRLDVGRCQPNVDESSRQEAYTYYVSESYQTTETHYDTVTEQQGQNCYTSFGPNGTTHQNCTPNYVTRSVPRTVTVTKTRQVPRTGYKTIVTRVFTFEVSGSVKMTAEERTVLQPFAVTGRTVQTTTTGGPEGTHVEGGDASDAEREALGRAERALAEARVRMDQERARAWLDKAARAESQGRELEAEDAHVTALRITGKPSAETRVFAERKLALEDDPAATLEGAAAPPPDTAKLALVGPGDELAKAIPTERDAPRDDEGELRGRASGRERGAFSLNGAYVETDDVAQRGASAPTRSGAGVSVTGEVALASRLARPLGPTLMDALRFELTAGLRTGTRADSTQQLDQVLLGVGAGYRILAGYRSERFGILGGLDARYRTFRVGDLLTYGFVAPLAVRGEWRINGPATVALSAWALSPFTDTQSVGASLDLPTTRSGWVLVARGEWLRMPASIGTTSGAREATSSSPETTSFTFGIGKQL